MRIGHLADTHLGFRRWSYTNADGDNQREVDVYEAFNQAIDEMVDRQVDAVVHAGDLFETHHPSTRALQVALDGFGRLRDAAIPVVAIPGNHSTPRNRTTGHVFGVLERFGVRAIWREPATVRVGDLAVTGIPHEHDRDAFLQHLRDTRPDPAAELNVLLLHAGTEGLAGGGDREGRSIELEAEMLDEGAGFDYVALGHLHSHIVPTPNACYAGSLERLTFQDAAPRKGWVEVDLAATGTEGFLALRPVDARPALHLPPVDATGCEDLLALLESALPSEDVTGAILRIPLVGVERATWRAFDRQAWAERTRRAFHVELFTEYASRESAVSRTGDLREFLRLRLPAGLNEDEVIERAEGFVRAAADELANE